MIEPRHHIHTRSHGGGESIGKGVNQRWGNVAVVLADQVELGYVDQSAHSIGRIERGRQRLQPMQHRPRRVVEIPSHCYQFIDIIASCRHQRRQPAAAGIADQDQPPRAEACFQRINRGTGRRNHFRRETGFGPVATGAAPYCRSAVLAGARKIGRRAIRLGQRQPQGKGIARARIVGKLRA
ncbi:hypothetical protein AC731_008855 [Thauera humireducens]|uniref:Uncharacterized protein n=1 Tax=Thauera humireducens TaxID=1134435 RepID=A0A127K513_9RHOO|nr:hypothetical protein AC731_008855 [Thauera humireducens]